ncbi:cation:proton antiporter domain-containing protein [Limobrevibacterium gyesilva]|uniref:Cation:proton antiporter n=1 Tax=Limobrevibacterium gyesilva TaxID=2991712 RepID=A0AA41YVJ8_9PROT|nr:cation:proton antiporter [Limobrevibacterium gyesilva]MCW3477220.1 cation:proton antiporter [Limobrevibacterium gyesilva]
MSIPTSIKSLAGALLGCSLAIFIMAPATLAANEAHGQPSEVLFVAQIVLLLIVGRLLGEGMQRIGQPPIMGQLLGGILLGPSVLGALLPDIQRAIFPATGMQKGMLDAVSQLGILMLLLLTGMEIDLALIRKMRRAAASVSIAGISVPFLCGFLLGQFMPQAMLPRPEMRLITALFLGIALSISSVKIVAAVIREMNFMRRTIGQLIVASAIIDDTIGWIVIAVILGLAQRGSVELLPLSVSVIGTALFLAASLTIGQRVVSALIRWTNDSFVSELPVITTILVIMGAMALVTHAIGVHTVLGAFVAGILVGRSPILAEHIRDNLRGLIVALFMPIFFGVAGLTADLTVLRDPALLLFVGGLVLIASVGKFGGAFLGGALAGLSHREAFALACGMNARGSTEVIVATIGLSIGVLNETLYTTIVTMAFVTTMAMPPMLRWALARLPMTPEEHDRLAREALETKGFVANLERVLLGVDRSANGQFASRLAGLLSAWRPMPITVLELGPDHPAGAPPSGPVPPLETVVKNAAESALAPDEARAQRAADVTTRARDAAAEDAVAREARKGYDLLLIGVGRTTDPDGGFHKDVTRLAASFDGPLVVVEARAAHLEDPRAANVNILVPVSGTDASRRALEVALAFAKSGTAPITLLYVSGTPKHAASRHTFGSHDTYTEDAVLREAVSLADQYRIATRTVIRRNLPIDDAIAEQVKRGRHDLVVLGVRPRSVGRLFFGDVAADLLERSSSSLVFVAS